MVFQLPYFGGTSRHGAPHRSRQSMPLMINGSVREVCPAAVLALDRQQILQDAPVRLGEIASAQAYLQKAALNQSARFASSTLRASGVQVRLLAEIRVYCSL